jgi:feruloyl esterase
LTIKVSFPEVFPDFESIPDLPHLTANAESYIPPDKLALVDAAVMISCDAANGLTDGLIQDPRKCGFDPASLLCSAANNSNCLNEAQVATLKSVYAGASKATVGSSTRA